MKNKDAKKAGAKQTMIDWQKLQENKQSIIDFIVKGADTRAQEQFSDQQLDRRNEIIHLQSGAQISLKEIQDTIAKSVQEYAPKFYKHWYQEIFRLNGWKKDKTMMHQKPHVVALRTNELIYRRFNNDVLPTIQALNPYVAMGIRLHKHHQWLSADGVQQLST